MWLAMLMIVQMGQAVAGGPAAPIDARAARHRKYMAALLAAGGALRDVHRAALAGSSMTGQMCRRCPWLTRFYKGARHCI